MVWCPMITAQYVLTQRLVGRDIPADRARGIQHYLLTVRAADGAWGLHPEASGSVFVTALAYVALRLLGLDRDEPALETARQWLHAQPGGVPAIPTWGKFWLALLDLYDWRGVNPTPPELFLLPRWLPFHPTRWYCHTRAIYVALACLHGRAPATPLDLRDELRQELYGTSWSALDFAGHAGVVSPVDVHAAPGRLLRTLQALLRRCPIPAVVATGRASHRPPRRSRAQGHGSRGRPAPAELDLVSRGRRATSASRADHQRRDGRGPGPIAVAAVLDGGLGARPEAR